MTIPELLIALAIGLGAGVVGGLAGIGGSIIMLPALAILLGYATEAKTEHHLYMAAAMLVNVVVAYSSKLEHTRAGAVRKDLTRNLLPAMAAAIVVGVGVSNLFDGRIAKLGLVGFLFVYCAFNVFTALRPRTTTDDPGTHERHARALLLAIGAITGFMAGFLGIGGGIVMVPMLQLLARVPIRQAIAASAAVMWVTAVIGSALKVGTLHQHGLHWFDALMLAAPIGAGALFGARIGASWTHRLPTRPLKLTISLILAVAAVRMAVAG